MHLKFTNSVISRTFTELYNHSLFQNIFITSKSNSCNFFLSTNYVPSDSSEFSQILWDVRFAGDESEAQGLSFGCLWSGLLYCMACSPIYEALDLCSSIHTALSTL
jgi:hypothetical protein